MRFSEHFGVNRRKDDSWFDPVLSVDTPLFVDPFLIYDNEQSVFRGSHSEINRFFKLMFKLIAKSGGNSFSNRYEKAVSDLVFPEVQELCLGYTAAGTSGAGSGTELGSIMASAIWDAIQAGMVHTEHFEEVTILRENIGPDRISDITANLLRHRLARYTQQICRRVLLFQKILPRRPRPPVHVAPKTLLQLLHKMLEMFRNRDYLCHRV